MRVLLLAGALALSTTLADGRTAPSFALKTPDGQAVRLADLRGQIVLVDFWASWCVPCQTTFPALDALAQSLRDHGVAVLAVDEDDKRRDLDAFLAVHPHTMRVLLDTRMATADAFEVGTIPTAFVIDGSGRIRFVHAGYGPETVDVLRQEIASLLDAK